MSELKKRNFHEAQWDESIIYEQSVPGSRGVLVPDVSEEASKVTGDVSELMPASLKRKQKPDLPELATAPRCCVTSCACPRRPSVRT